MSRIILPLDNFKSKKEILTFVNKIKDIEKELGINSIHSFKLNDALIQFGLDIIRCIKLKGYKVMADPKLYDIPNTMNNSLNALIKAGADIITIHCSSAYIPQNQEQADRIAGVTVLTSMSEVTCKDIYNRSVQDTVNNFAANSVAFGYKYMVCSAQDLNSLDSDYKNKFDFICPGIRPKWYLTEDDQSRVATPEFAIQKGAELLVIGRPILKAKDMFKAICETNDEISKALLN